MSAKSSPTAKPFIPNANRRNYALQQALSALRAAKAELAEAATWSQHWAEYETIKDFEKQLDEFLSCDNGEAGFIPYCEMNHAETKI